MNKELIVSSNRHETMVAILEDDQVSEIYIEREQQGGVVVAALRLPIELAGAIEQPRDAGHAVGTVERQFKRPGRIPAKLIAERKMHDALAIPLRVEPFDFAKIVESSLHRIPCPRHEQRIATIAKDGSVPAAQ